MNYISEETRKKMSESRKKLFANGYTVWNKGKPLGFTPKMAFKKGHKTWNKGLKTGLVPTSAFKKGIIPWNTGKKYKIGKVESKIGKHYSPETEFKKGLIVPRGKDHWSWKGGKDRRKLIMGRKEYVLWRTTVFMRDDYTCQICLKRGGILNADHIKPFALFPELIYAIDNGRTLCEDCHKQTDTYGGRVFNWLES